MRTRSNGRKTSAAAIGLALVGLGAVGLGGALGAGIAQQRAAAPTSVATVDLQRLLDELQETEDRRADLQAAGQQRVEELTELQTSIQDLITELETLPEGSESEQIRLQIEISAGQQELQTRDGLYAQERQLQITQLLIDMSAKGIAATARVAERDGYDIVLHDNSTALSSVPNVEPVQALISRTTLYAGEATDITASVVALMNNEYAAGG